MKIIFTLRRNLSRSFISRNERYLVENVNTKTPFKNIKFSSLRNIVTQICQKRKIKRRKKSYIVQNLRRIKKKKLVLESSLEKTIVPHTITTEMVEKN